MDNKMIIDILEYYLKYEVYKILNSSEISVCQDDIIQSDLNNIDSILEVLKQNKISKELNNLIGEKLQDIQKVKTQVLMELDNGVDIVENRLDIFEKLKKIIEENINYKKDVKYEKVILNSINKILDIASLNEFFLYSHFVIYYGEHKDEIKRLPIFIFKCEKNDGETKVLEVNVNNEAIKTIISKIFDREISEIDLEYSEKINNFSQEIRNTIDCGDIDHLLELYYQRFEKTFGIDNNKLNNMTGNIVFQKEYIISLDDLAKGSIKNIKEDIKLLLKLINNDKYIPNLLNKYLNNSEAKKAINDDKYDKAYLGNYNKTYGVSRTQYKIVNTIKYNDLIAIEGPPGTGKTSLLKEIITNSIVERANLILKNWDKGFKEVKYYNYSYYDIEWFKQESEVIKSIVVSSKNGEAIENVGKEVNKEVKYFYPIARKYERIEKIKKQDLKVLQNYKGIVCLPLGKKDNIKSFYDFLNGYYIPFLEKIKNSSKLEKIVEQVKYKYKKKLDELNYMKTIINSLGTIQNNEKYFYGITVDNEDKDIPEIEKRFKADISSKNEKLSKYREESKRILNEKTNEYEKVKRFLNKLDNIQNNMKVCQSNILNGKNEISKLKNQKQYFEKISKNIFVRLLKRKDYKKYKDIDFDSKINEISIINETENERIKSYIEQENQIKEQLNNCEEIKNKLEDEYCSIETKLKKLEKELTEMSYIEKYNKYDTKKYWGYKDTLDIYGHGIFNKLNYDLFILALKLNEAYIAKNSQEIIKNLKLFVTKQTTKKGDMYNICQNFYDSSGIYGTKKKLGIQSLWNTMFLCFPVITTTLDSFYSKCFQLIPEYIDLELIDEAGQILPHNLIPALYRGKKAVIVGDVNQIEPIYNYVSNSFMKNKEAIGEIFDEIKIDDNSVQAIANKNTDILENGKPIILNEHYRCERNIINFSNQNVYKNKLYMNEADNMNKPFNNNMIALDVRGKKETNENVNMAEVESCIETAKFIINQGNNPTIAIITPFVRQKEKIYKRIKKEKLKNVTVGTVHTFQGQEKDYVIFSQVIDSLKKEFLTNFIGKKCNMLNVAVTRAKKQFIFLGNLDVAREAENYITKLINYIEKSGVVYSLYSKDYENNENYDEEILKILQPEIKLLNDEIGTYIKNNLKNNIISDAKKHYDFLKYAIINAKEEIYIMSPWYRDNVMNDEFFEYMRNLKNKNCKIKINFGYRKGNDNISNTDELVEELKKTNSLGFVSEKMAKYIADKMYEIVGKDSFVYAPPMHAKLFIIDGKYMCIGSHNWLSNAGITNEKQRAKEISVITTSKSSIEYIKENLFK